VLRSYRIDSCLIRPNGPLATVLAGSSEWKVIYKDAVCAIFVRTAKELSSSPGVSAAVKREGRRRAET